MIPARAENSRLARAALRRLPAVARRRVYRGEARFRPVCESLESHRPHRVYLRERPALFDGRACRLLHVAPEAVLEGKLRALPGVRYVSADLCDPRAGLPLLPVPPIRAERTSEDPAESDPAECRRRSGHPDHLRRYGRDYPERLRAAGTRVEALAAAELVGESGVRRLGLGNGDEIFRCGK